MRSFCSKEWAGNDVAGKCGEFAGLTVYDNYEQNATLALNMCNEAYGSETTAAIETASPMDDCVAAIQREVKETDEEGEDDDGGVDGRLLEDHSSPDHPSSGEGAHTPEQQQGGGQQGGPPQDASKQKIICHKGCGLLCMPAGVNSDGSGQEKLKFDQEHGPPTSDNNENTKDSSAATPPATTTSGSTSTTSIPSATTESSITTSTPPTSTSTTTAAATASSSSSVASTVAIPAEGEPEEAAAAATSTNTRIESAMDQDPTNPKTLTEFDVGIQKPSFGETLMINFVMIAAIGASVGTVVLLAAKKMKLKNQKYSQISQIIEDDEEDVEMHQNDCQNDTDEEDEDGERFCLVEPRRISE